MCGRYTLHQKGDNLAKRYGLSSTPDSIRDNFNVAPGHFMPVVVEEDGKPKLEMMKWGLVPVWAKDPRIGYKMINARSESIFEKPSWRSVILRKRCLIPADGFYEWKKFKTDEKERKQPFFIHPKQIELFSFAGVWEAWKDSENNIWKTYSIITTEPNKEMSSIHDRMPVILHPEDESSWLESSRVTRDSIEPLLRPLEDNALEMYKVSEDVNTVKNNDKHLLVALEN